MTTRYKRESRPSRSSRRSGGGSRGRYVLGLMAGTSGDGIDAACVRIVGLGERMQVRYVAHFHRPFRPALRRRLMAAMAPAVTTTEELARLHADLGDAFADAACRAIEALKRKERPSLVGLAGQTVCHLPGARGGRTVTLQLGEPARVAVATGLTTVAEFRQSDVAVGGQGAPLVPWTDWVLFGRQRVSHAIQNIGGIGNVTWLPAGGGPDEVVAFDTGPGNMVIDGVVARITAGRERMDRGGRRAARGRVLGEVLEAWLQYPFFDRSPPRTTGREEFGAGFVEAEWGRLRAASSSPDDWVATATAFTARSIASSYRRFLGLGRCGAGAGADRKKAAGAAGSGGQKIQHHCTSPRTPKSPRPHVSGHAPPNSFLCPEVIVCGGGSRNPTLMGMLAGELPGIAIRPIDELGIPTQAKEAVSFAMLAAARMDGVPTNLPQATGAGRRASLGQIVDP